MHILTLIIIGVVWSNSVLVLGFLMLVELVKDLVTVVVVLNIMTMIGLFLMDLVLKLTINAFILIVIVVNTANLILAEMILYIHSFQKI